MDFSVLDQFARPGVQPSISVEALYVVPAVLLCILTGIIYRTSGFEDVTYKAYYTASPMKFVSF